VTDSNVFQLSQPGTLSDPLTEVLRNGARALLAQAVAAEVAGFLEGHADKLTEDGRQRLVRHGHLPEREIMTGIGPVAVRAPRIRDRVGTGEERIAFSSAILPPYARRSKSLEVLIPILYLKGISTGGFEEALAALLGKDAGGLSASTIARLRDVWAEAPGELDHGAADPGVAGSGEPLFATARAALIRRACQAGVTRHCSAVTHWP
jgi:transposase-like protein